MGFNMKVTPEIEALTKVCEENSKMDVSLYGKYDVKRGLRDINGKGVLAGLTQVSNIVSSKTIDGKSVPCDGELYYRGINIRDLTNGFLKENRFGFEETTYLLLFGVLPTEEQLKDFCKILGNQRSLPRNFVRDVIMKAPSKDMMNTLSRSVLTLYSYDSNPEDISLPNVLRQCINLISIFPMLSVYGYQAHRHYNQNKSLYIHNPKKELSTAENILRMLRSDKKYTPLEAKILDLALVLHMEHGGGNNSTFTTHVVSSSGTDTYSAIAAALGSLKGPKHGGANIKVVSMFDDMKKHVHDWKDEEEVSAYLRKLLHKEAFDKRGLIYGMGHAVYTLSDPRAVILKRYAKKLAEAKGKMDEFHLYETVEEVSKDLIMKAHLRYKPVCANVDFYSGFVYTMLGIPTELFTPIFAMARIVGWSAHRMEELINVDKIIRPAYQSIMVPKAYESLADRSTPKLGSKEKETLKISMKDESC